MLTNLQYCVLHRMFPHAPDCCSGRAYEGKSKLAILLGGDFFTQIKDKVVIDFGCGEGADAVEMASKGAKRVIGLDIREDFLQTATRLALAARVQERCKFTTRTEEQADVIVSLDAFPNDGRAPRSAERGSRSSTRT